MARAVYSTRFLGIETASSDSSTYTVPAGFVAVVRDITAYLSSSAVTLVQAYLVDPSLVLLDAHGDAGTPKVVQWAGRTVCTEGEQLQVAIVTTAAASIAVSGYLLSS